MPWSALGGGIAGALIVLLLVSGLRSAFVPPSDAELDQRMTDLESQIKVLAGRPAPAGVAQKAFDDLAARVGQLEQAPRLRPDAAIDTRLAALEAGTKPLADGITALNRRADETAATLRELHDRIEAVARTADATPPAAAPSEVSQADFDQLKARVTALDAASRRVAALESAVASLEDTFAKAAKPDRATRLALFSFALESAVMRGTPYEAELAGVRALVDDPKLIEPLQPFAARGVPSSATLAKELAGLAPKLPGTPPATTPSGIVDRLKANAERLVRIRRVDEAASDEPAAVLARMQTKSAQGDVAGALADAAKLPADARAVVGGWMQQTAARQAAIAAARQLSANSFAALSRGTIQSGSQQ